MVSLGKVRVCDTCVGRVDAMNEVLCSRCGDAMGMESARFTAAMGVSECTMCRLAPPEFERAVAFANYDNEMREMLHLLKFESRARMAEFVLGERLAQAVLKLEDIAAKEMVVVPVPLFAARERERGFNQAMLLAKAAVESLKKMRPSWKLEIAGDVMLRVKDTRSLYRLNPSQRRRNLRGAFKVANDPAIRGREVLLIDDIMTTGATARECSRVLLRAGAAKVWVATAAKAQPESVRNVVRQEVATWDVAATKSTSQKRDVGHPVVLVEPDVWRRKSFSSRF
jgi:ComF family protein